MAKLSPYETGELTDSIFFTMLALLNPIHGYSIMQKVSELTENRIVIGPATMYTTLGKMVKAEWIQEKTIDSNKKEYQITDKGKEILKKHIENRKFLLGVAEKLIDNS